MNLFDTQKIKAGDICKVVGNVKYDYESKKNIFPEHFLKLETLVFVNFIIVETQTAIVTSTVQQLDNKGRKLTQYIALQNLEYQYEYKS